MPDFVLCYFIWLKKCNLCLLLFLHFFVMPLWMNKTYRIKDILSEHLLCLATSACMNFILLSSQLMQNIKFYVNFLIFLNCEMVLSALGHLFVTASKLMWCPLLAWNQDCTNHWWTFTANVNCWVLHVKVPYFKLGNNTVLSFIFSWFVQQYMYLQPFQQHHSHMNNRERNRKQQKLPQVHYQL